MIKKALEYFFGIQICNIFFLTLCDRFEVHKISLRCALKLIGQFRGFLFFLFLLVFITVNVLYKEWKKYAEGTLFNYVDLSLPFIDHLPTPDVICKGIPFFYKGKSA